MAKQETTSTGLIRHPIQEARDWSGADDPGNPRNFSLTRKVMATLTYTLLAFVSTFAASLYSPGIDQVRYDFGCSDEVAILPLSLYNLGMAFGPLIGSPLSETAGRKVVILITTPLFALFTLGAGFSNSVASLIVCRFFAGVFAAPAIGNASATITDYTDSRHRGTTMGFYYAVPTFGAVLGPLVGGFIVEARGWRWTQWTTIFFIVTFYIPIIFTRETYKKTILQQRAKRLNIEGPPTPQRTLMQSVHYFTMILVLRPAHMLVTEPIVTLVCLYSGFLFGLMYTYVIASPWIYQHYYNFDLTAQSLSFIGLATGALTATIPLTMLDYYLYQPRLRKFQSSYPPDTRCPPENRLYPAMIASPLLPAFLFLFAWTARPSIHWVVPIISQSLAMASSVMIYAPCNLFMIDAYGPLYGASAAGAAMLCRYSQSTAFPLFSLQMYRALGVGWATSILAFCTLAMAPIPWLFWHFGEQIRQRTKYETSA
ncbi:related to TPO4-Proposed vacuolar polyamine transporter [Lecanosticta acicola]|uniref:Related to TPO4-Proposed vacuolar polyamine transporter n=1 Tax=Lecanosticta acicola TaxID=111012 RepID=A0AAI8Z5M7_9PEZI|nr:related to TPO4-Proposed vacuolar polyamine transporter [Lecanosticta acicola]